MLQLLTQLVGVLARPLEEQFLAELGAVVIEILLRSQRLGELRLDVLENLALVRILRFLGRRFEAGLSFFGKPSVCLN